MRPYSRVALRIDSTLRWPQGGYLCWGLVLPGCLMLGQCIGVKTQKVPDTYNSGCHIEWVGFWVYRTGHKCLVKEEKMNTRVMTS